jgi:hypothetical protein
LIIFGEIRNGKMSVNVTSRNIKYKNNNEVRDWIYTKKDLNQVVVVQDSVAILPVIRVDIFSKEKKLSVEFIQVSGVVNTKIFEMDFSAEIPIVTLIDLRPVGYNVFGDSTALNIGEQKYQGNMFENMHSLVKLENVTN